jgi:hypothetical protein
MSTAIRNRKVELLVKIESIYIGRCYNIYTLAPARLG